MPVLPPENYSLGSRCRVLTIDIWSKYFRFSAFLLTQNSYSHISIISNGNCESFCVLDFVLSYLRWRLSVGYSFRIPLYCLGKILGISASNNLRYRNSFTVESVNIHTVKFNLFPRPAWSILRSLFSSFKHNRLSLQQTIHVLRYQPDLIGFKICPWKAKLYCYRNTWSNVSTI